MLKTFISRIPLLLATLLIACTSPDNQRLEKALQFAGNNRDELEKVLTHYANDPEKLAAARFLIMNMPGHTGVDPSCIKTMQPFYEKHAKISQKHHWERSSQWYKEIDSLWKNEKLRILPQLASPGKTSGPSRRSNSSVKSTVLLRLGKKMPIHKTIHLKIFAGTSYPTVLLKGLTLTMPEIPFTGDMPLSSRTIRWTSGR